MQGVRETVIHITENRIFVDSNMISAKQDLKCRKHARQLLTHKPPKANAAFAFRRMSSFR